MEKKIQSYGQQGGITAGEVNVETSSGPSQGLPAKKPILWKVAGVISAAAGFIAAVVGILTYFGIMP